MKKGEERELHEGDLLRLGNTKGVTFKITGLRLKACTTRVSGAELSQLQQLAKQCAIQIESRWTSDCTHLFTSSAPCPLTPKMICALADGKSILRSDWLLALVSGADKIFPPPNLFLPLKADGSSHFDAKRIGLSSATLFRGISFLFFSRVQMNSFRDAIESCGGFCAAVFCEIGKQQRFVLSLQRKYTNAILVQPAESSISKSAHIVSELESQRLALTSALKITQSILKNSVEELRSLPNSDQENTSTRNPVLSSSGISLKRKSPPAEPQHCSSSFTRPEKLHRYKSDMVERCESVALAVMEDALAPVPVPAAAAASHSASSVGRTTVRDSGSSSPSTVGAAASSVAGSGCGSEAPAPTSGLLPLTFKQEPGANEQDYSSVTFRVARRQPPVASPHCQSHSNFKTFRKAPRVFSFNTDRLKVKLRMEAVECQLASVEFQQQQQKWQEDDQRQEHLESMFEQSSSTKKTSRARGAHGRVRR